MIGININCKELPFVDWIIEGYKNIETRSPKKDGTGSLDCYIGQRVGLIETGKGKALLKGYATISAKFIYGSSLAWDNHFYMHRVPVGSKYDFVDKKIGYLLEDVEMCEPRFINSKGIVARQI